MTNDSTKPPSALTPQSTTPDAANKIAANKKVTLPGLHARLRDPKVVADSDPNTRANRIALMLDCSGSMRGSRIASLRDACASFITSCNFTDTALAIETFGEAHNESRLALTAFQPICLTTVMQLQACGSTPMHEALDYVLNTYSVTRGVLVSDGQPDSVDLALQAAEHYRDAGTMVDCVHIGDSTHGEDTMRRIAEITGGQFIKFTDITAFSRSFKYLTPAYYAQLTSGSVSAAQLGAKEIK